MWFKVKSSVGGDVFIESMEAEGIHSCTIDDLLSISLGSRSFASKEEIDG